MYDHALLIAYVLGVAAIAESAHLVDRKEGPRHAQNSTAPCLKDHSQSRVTRCPPEAHNQSQLKHSFIKAKMHTNTSRPFCHTAHIRAHLISCVGGVIPPHCNHICSKPSLHPGWSYSPLSICLINWHGLSCHATPGGVQRSYRIWDTPTYHHGQVVHPNSETLAREATPNQRQ